MVQLTFEVSGAAGGLDGAAGGGAWVLRRADPGPAMVGVW